MILPDQLVQAAVKEYAMYTDERMTKRQVDGITHALAAAFAALPECEAVDPGRDYPQSCRDGWNDCLEAIAALARGFGEPT